MAQMNLSEKQKDSQTQRSDLWLPGRGRGRGWRGMDREFEINRCKLLYV